MSAGSSATRAAGSYGRRRAGLACQVCRARKTKCDNQRPVCGFCQATGGQCVYPEQATDHSQLDRGSLLILQRIGELEKSLKRHVTDATRANQLVFQGGGPDSLLPTLLDDGRATRAPETISPRGPGSLGPEQVAAVDSGHVQGDSPPTADIIRASSEMTVESLLAWPVFQTAGSRQDPSLISILGRVEPGLDPHAAPDGIYDIDPGVVRHHVSQFLSTNHIKNPVFDIENLWADVREFIESGLRWNGVSCLVLLICALSVLSSPIDLGKRESIHRGRGRFAQAEAYFQAAQRRIGALLHENSLLAVQCTFLTAVYLMSTMRIFAAWKSFSQAGTQCLGWLAGRGRADNSASYPPLDSHEINNPQRYVEESLYWSCLKSELELKMELVLPGSSLNEMKYPHVYPSPPEPMPHAWGVASEVTEETRSEFESGWFFYLAEIATRRILNDALLTRYSPQSWYMRKRWWAEPDEEEFLRYVQDFNAKLSSWYDTLPPRISFPADPDENVGDVLRGILRGHLIDIREVLYFPALKALMVQSLREIGPATSSLVRQGLENDVYRIKICVEGFEHRHQGTWLMIRSCSRSCLHLLSVALRAQEDSAYGDFMPDGWRLAVQNVCRLIGIWEQESPDLGLLRARIQEIGGRLGVL